MGYSVVIVTKETFLIVCPASLFHQLFFAVFWYFVNKTPQNNYLHDFTAPCCRSFQQVILQNDLPPKMVSISNVGRLTKQKKWNMVNRASIHLVAQSPHIRYDQHFLLWSMRDNRHQEHVTNNCSSWGCCNCT